MTDFVEKIVIRFDNNKSFEFDLSKDLSSEIVSLNNSITNNQMGKKEECFIFLHKNILMTLNPIKPCLEMNFILLNIENYKDNIKIKVKDVDESIDIEDFVLLVKANGDCNVDTEIVNKETRINIYIKVYDKMLKLGEEYSKEEGIYKVCTLKVY